jgi:hypothetical protein
LVALREPGAAQITSNPAGAGTTANVSDPGPVSAIVRLNEARHQLSAVRLHGFNADSKPAGNLLSAASFCDQVQTLPAGTGRPPRSKIEPSIHYGPNGNANLARRRVLQEVARCAGAQRLQCVLRG